MRATPCSLIDDCDRLLAETDQALRMIERRIWSQEQALTRLKLEIIDLPVDPRLPLSEEARNLRDQMIRHIDAVLGSDANDAERRNPTRYFRDFLIRQRVEIQQRYGLQDTTQA